MSVSSATVSPPVRPTGASGVPIGQAATPVPAAPPSTGLKVDIPEAALAKERLRYAASLIDPLSPIKKHPFVSTFAAFSVGMVLSNIPLNLKIFNGLIGLGLKSAMLQLQTLATAKVMGDSDGDDKKS